MREIEKAINVYECACVFPKKKGGVSNKIHLKSLTTQLDSIGKMLNFKQYFQIVGWNATETIAIALKNEAHWYIAQLDFC